MSTESGDAAAVRALTVASILKRTQPALREYTVPVFITVKAENAEHAVALVAEALTTEGFEWPEALAVVCYCVGNESEVTE